MEVMTLRDYLQGGYEELTKRIVAKGIDLDEQYKLLDHEGMATHPDWEPSPADLQGLVVYCGADQETYQLMRDGEEFFTWYISRGHYEFAD